MKIINKTKNTVLAEDVIIADTLFKRMIGLLGKKGLKQGQALILRPCNSIHTFFMQFPIDVIFVDSDNKIVKAISNMHPFRISGIYFKARSAIELPAQTIEKTSTQKGDYLVLI
jgi:hypothetical protein